MQNMYFLQHRCSVPNTRAMPDPELHYFYSWRKYKIDALQRRPVFIFVITPFGKTFYSHANNTVNRSIQNIHKLLNVLRRKINFLERYIDII